MDTRSEDELRAAAQGLIAEYDEAVERALQERDAKIRQLKTEGGWKQAELVRATGYSRETIRQALNPKIRAQIKARRAARQTAGEQSDTTEET